MCEPTVISETSKSSLSFNKRDVTKDIRIVLNPCLQLFFRNLKNGEEKIQSGGFNSLKRLLSHLEYIEIGIRP